MKENKTIWIIIVAIIVFICLIFAASYAVKHLTPSQIPEEKPEVATKPTQAKQSAPTPASNAIASVSPTDTSSNQNTNFSPLVDDNIRTKAIPTDPALVKDEIAQLQDIQTQLNTQKADLEKQQQDADQLIKLKEEQIKDMEQQLKASS